MLSQQAESKTNATAKATFAGGCFWCMEPPFEKLDGVHSVISGYIGGHKENPTYKDVTSGKSGHLEAIEISYDPSKVSYQTLLEVFWQQIDPFVKDRQFVDYGSQYQAAIFYHNDEQKKLAEASLQYLKSDACLGKDAKIETLIKATSKFYPAEDYHQDYYKKSPLRYKLYSTGSGRKKRLAEIWGGKSCNIPIKSKSTSTEGKKYMKPSEDELKKKLTDLQYKVTQQEGTERPFQNEYWDNKQEGIYVDVVSGEPLFSSTHKFKSGTGWPSFYQPLDKSNVVEKTDRKMFIKRTEVRSKHGDSHLGHLFNDGPAPTGMRYCINSASLRFIPAEKLKQEGYTEFERLFKKN